MPNEKERAEEARGDRQPPTAKPPHLPPERVRVYCSQFAECRWTGVRLSDRLGVQPRACPSCGREVLR